MSVSKSNRPRWHAAKTRLNFACDWGVFPGGEGRSLCYCTDPKRARLIARALNFYLKNGGRIE